MLEARNISFAFGNKEVFRNLTFAVERGERVSLQAPSGQGKTTLCRVLSGYLQPAEGEVLVDGKPLPRRGVCPVQLILQHPEKAIDPRLRLIDTLEEAGPASSSLLERFEIEPNWLERYPHELSGGELQRICIARALTANPSYLIADEMTTMLDAVTQAKIWQSLLKEAEERNLGMIVVSHSHALTQILATRTESLSGLTG